MSGGSTRGLSRQQALGAALAAGGALAGGMLLGGTPDAAESLQSGNREDALNRLLRLERIQVALYSEARDGGVLSGQLAALASTLADQEAEHVETLTGLLGSAAAAPPQLEFGRATRDAVTFGRATRQLEDLAARSYNLEIPRLRGRALREALRIASVEARHAAWIRDLLGENPAPDAVEPLVSDDDVRAALDRTGFLR